MKITVMTADEQIITLDVDPHESVTLQNLVFGHTFIHECMCAYTYVYVCANTHKLINCYFSFSFFLNFYIWVCRNRLKTWRLCLKWRWDLFDMLFLYWVLCCAWLIRKYGEGNRLRFWIINAICKNLKLYYTDVCVCVCVSMYAVLFFWLYSLCLLMFKFDLMLRMSRQVCRFSNSSCCTMERRWGILRN